jgi:hypothetical protein
MEVRYPMIDIRSKQGDFLINYLRAGHQKFYQPSTVALPSGITLNAHGWINCPTSSDIVIPMEGIKPNEDRTLYWFSESIQTNSSATIRMSLEGNLHYDEQLGDFDPTKWFVQSGYAVRSDKNHYWSSGVPIKMRVGEAMRLRVYSSSGNNNDFYFKYMAVEAPWTE